MTTEAPNSILTLLHENKLLSEANLVALQAYATNWSVSPFVAIIETNVMSEQDLADHLAEILKIDRVYHLSALNPSAQALKALGFKRAKAWECFPAGWRDEEHRVFEAIFADPTSAEDKIRDLAAELECEIALAVGERSDIVGTIDVQFPLAEQLPSLFNDHDEKSFD